MNEMTPPAAQWRGAGVYRDMSEDAYHRDPAPRPSLSSSLARILLDQSPLHAWTASPRLNPEHEPRDSASFDIGRACHALLLGRGAAIHVIDADNFTTKAAREERDKAREMGATPMLAHQHEAAIAMLRVVERRLAQHRIEIDRERTEMPVFAEIEGVWCRALIDYAPVDPRLPLYDYKTCEDASPEACIRAVANYGYDVQAAHYLATWEAATGERRRFRFIFQEKAPPHEVTVVELHGAPDDEGDWMLDAASKIGEARRIWRECLDADQWPGYPARVALVGAPAWHRQKWANRETGRPVIEKPSAAMAARAAQFQSPEGIQ